MGTYAEVLYYAVVVIALASAVYAYVVASNISGVTDSAAAKYDPRSDLVVTSVKEGMPVPICFGTVRIAGNLLFYGNVISEVVNETVTTQGGGKGSGGGDSSQQVFKGYNYYLDAWIGICINDHAGAITIPKIFVNDDLQDINAEETNWSDGTDSSQTMDFFNTDITTISGEALPEDLSFTLAHGGVIPNSLKITGSVSVLGMWVSGDWFLTDDGNGSLFAPGNISMGTIVYATGDVHITGAYSYLPIAASYMYGTKAKNVVIYHDNYLKNVAWYAWKKWFVGLNASNMPNVQFLVVRTLPTSPITHANMTNGLNPAAVVYELLTNKLLAGVASTLIDLATFQAAAAVWYAKGYGINFYLNEQVEIAAIIETIMGWVGGAFYMTPEGKFALHAFDPDEAAAETLTEDDFIEFSIQRQSWNETVNDLRINYTDPGTNGETDITYVTKMFGIYDQANARIQGCVKQKELDLLCFIDAEAASRRAWELLKANSYPMLSVDFKLTQQFPTLHVGSVVSISHSDYGMVNVTFRIVAIDCPNQESVDVFYKAEQMLEQVFDSNFTAIGSGSGFWVQPDVTPQQLAYKRIYEMPWNPWTKETQTFLFLAARVGVEEACSIMTSLTSGSGFSTISGFSMFSQYGTLDVTYVATTYSIDDEVGLIYTPYRNDLNPGDLSRTNLFNALRFAIVEDEIMAFQLHQPYGGSSYKLLGVMRGLFGTVIAQHNAGVPIWLFSPVDNLKPLEGTATFYAKMVPYYKTTSADSGGSPVTTVVPAQKAKTPSDIEYVEAVRTGSTVVITWFTCTRQYPGAGSSGEDAQNDTWPLLFDGDFEYNASGVVVSGYASATLTVTNPLQLSFAVRNRIGGMYGAWSTSLTVGVDDGTYVMGISGVT